MYAQTHTHKQMSELMNIWNTKRTQTHSCIGHLLHLSSVLLVVLLFILQSGNEWHIYTRWDNNRNGMELNRRWNEILKLTRRMRDQMIVTNRETVRVRDSGAEMMLFICCPWAHFSFLNDVVVWLSFLFFDRFGERNTSTWVLLITCAFMLNIVQYLISFLNLWDRFWIHNVSNGVSAFQFTAING